MAADVTGKAHESFCSSFLPVTPHLVGIDDNDEITGIDVWSEDRFSFPRNRFAAFTATRPSTLILRIDEPPFAWDFRCFR